ncbi:MAG TPA: hypothetical protein VGG39_34160 [Polyangiaceae bacterium]|jgi:hypothetical protein
MRRVLLVVPVLAAGAIVWACTAFDFPRPSATTSDAAGDDAPGDEGTPGDAGVSPAAFLSADDAARVCALVFRCPGLGEAIELSYALPVATPASPLSFSGCMDWLSGPIAPGRIGLSEVQSALRAVAGEGTCDGAAGHLPVVPALDAGSCLTGCADKVHYETCAGGAEFLLECQPPFFGAPGQCLADSGLALCITGGPCTQGLACTDAGVAGTLVDCYGKTQDYVSYDCSLSGRQCTVQGTRLADCVAPGSNTAPCPLDDVKDDCDQGSVRHCAGGVTAQTEIDCQGAVPGATCSTSNTPGVARCVYPDARCTPFDDDVDQCAADGGAAISLCVAGQRTSFSCASVGLACQPATAAQSGHCGP